jgi:ABC-type spermidine/putrescine transport system permease subunit II
MIQIGGVMTAIFLLGVVAATWYLRRTEVDRRLFGSGLFNALLVISSVAIGLLGLYTLLNVFGLEIG